MSNEDKLRKVAEALAAALEAAKGIGGIGFQAAFYTDGSASASVTVQPDGLLSLGLPVVVRPTSPPVRKWIGRFAEGEYHGLRIGCPMTEDEYRRACARGLNVLAELTAEDVRGLAGLDPRGVA